MRPLVFATSAAVLLGCGASSGAGSGGSATSSRAASSGTGASMSTSVGGAGGGVTLATSTSGGFPTSAASTSGPTSTSASTSGATSSSSGGTGGGKMNSGDCKTDADCMSGQCIAVTPGGFRVCFVPPKMATTCTNAQDQCCPASKPCPSNEPCYLGPLVPACSGAVMIPHNQCAVDQCAKDVDCAAGQICAPAGTLGLEIRACVNAHCKYDTQCTLYPGGICAPVKDPCCAASDGLFCVYPANGGCRDNAACGQGQYCALDTVKGVASCHSGGPLCPG
jgi:hypothetical protein